MNIIKNCQGTMEICLPLEIGVDTVYVRENIKRVTVMEMEMWQYDETQYSIEEYNTSISQKLTKENKELKEEITEMSSYILDLEFNILGGM